MPEWRRDPISGESVIIAEGRLARPVDYARPSPPSTTTSCPFCEGNEAQTPEEIVARRPPGGRANGRGWTVRVIPNKFPTFDASSEPWASALAKAPRWAAPRALGAHEIVIQSPAHFPGLPFLPTDRVREVLEVYRERLDALERSVGVQSIVLAENWGPDSGGSLTHPHGQLLATPELLPGLEIALRMAERRAQEWDVPCPVEHVLNEERSEGRRLVFEDEHVALVAPFASAVPYQLRFVPRRHARSFSQATDGELHSLAAILPRAERALLDLFPSASYNLAATFPPPGPACPPAFHGSIDLLPRLTRGDAFELVAHVPVNPIPPEVAAERYRNAWSGPR